MRTLAIDGGWRVFDKPRRSFRELHGIVRP